jgi:hypothetical protein
MTEIARPLIELPSANTESQNSPPDVSFETHEVNGEIVDPNPVLNEPDSAIVISFKDGNTVAMDGRAGVVLGQPDNQGGFSRPETREGFQIQSQFSGDNIPNITVNNRWAFFANPVRRVQVVQNYDYSEIARTRLKAHGLGTAAHAIDGLKAWKRIHV